MQVMHDLRMILQECPHDVFAQLQREGEVIPVIVMGDIFPPVKRPARIAAFGVLPPGHSQIDLFITAVHLQNRGDQHDRILADRFDKIRFVYSDAVGQLHQHFRGSCFSGVHGAGGPVHRFGLPDELFGVLF